MKKSYIISGIIIMVLLIGSIMTKNVYAQNNTDTEVSNSADFVINENGILERYKGSDSTVVVPDTVNEIGYKAFSNCTFIEKIVLPEGLTVINYSAFENCSNLKEINLPSELKQLPSFYGCTSLKEITIPKGITETSWYGFERNNGIERINVSEDNEVLSSIDGVIYSKDKTRIIHYPVNRKDETYIIPDSVTTLSDADFYSANYLKHLVFGKNVALSSDDDYGFNGSSFLNGSLESFTVPASNKYYCDIDGVLFTKDKKTLLAYPEKKAGEAYIIPDGTTTLYIWSLSKEEDTDMELKYIFVPKSVKKIMGNVGYIGYSEGFGPNSDILFFGNKGSAIENYVKENHLKFGYYDSSKKGTQVLFDSTDISLGLSETYKVNAILWPMNPKESITWKTSKKSIAEVDKQGKITAKGLGTATITATTKSGASSSIKVSVRLPKPDNVKVVKNSSTDNYAKITWDKVDGAKGYDVYLCDWQGYDLVPGKKLGTTTKNSFVDKTIKLDEYTYYAVVAYHNNKNYNSEHTTASIYIPSPPSVVSITKNFDGINISWDGEYIYYNTGYAIYRSTTKNGKYTEIGTARYDSFLDTNVKSGTTYYYKICSYIENSNGTVYSSYTSPVSITR